MLREKNHLWRITMQFPATSLTNLWRGAQKLQEQRVEKESHDDVVFISSSVVTEQRRIRETSC